jgi:oxygen-independent coproporphyrinogen-3 oxidase
VSSQNGIETATESFEAPEKAPTWLGLQAPRYTSYPSAQHFHRDVNTDQHATWLASMEKDQTISAYVHIPFCRELCWFCGCHTKMTYRDEPIEKYVRVLLDEIALIGGHAAGKGKLKQIHLGGGSPSLLNQSQLMSILYALAAAFEFSPPGELAIELDPRTTSEEKIAFYGSLGFTRVSMGIQDFDPKVQKAVNRIQSFEMVAGLMQHLHDAGIHQINTDLIYGLPYQTIASFEHTLKQTLSLAPSRIALFSYAHVPHMKKHQRLIDESTLPDDSAKLLLYRMATDFLLANGYVAIGIDHFARADDSLAVAASSHRMRRNFQGYVTDTTDILLGFGTSAISQFPAGYTQNYSATHEYSKHIEAEELATCRGWKAGAEDSFRKEIIDTLMCYMEADIGQIAERHGLDANICVRELQLLQECAYSDIVHTQGNLVQIATPYRMASRAVAAVFDQYQLPDSARYSRVS